MVGKIQDSKKRTRDSMAAAGFAVDTNCCTDEDHDRSHEDHEDEARLDVHHEPGCGETCDGKQTLTDGIPVRS